MKIVIIGAMEKEVERYLEIYNAEIVDRERKIYKAKDEEIIIARSGIGKVNSAMMTQYIIDKFEPDVVISSGCAGSLTKELEVLDVIIPPFVTYHDFLPERVMKFSTPDGGNIIVDEDLRKLFKDVMEKIPSAKYKELPICSGDCYVTTEEEAKRIIGATGCLVVDMESASIGHVARKNKVPFITIRTISDFANGADDFETVASRLASDIISKCLEKLLTI